MPNRYRRLYPDQLGIVWVHIVVLGHNENWESEGKREKERERVVEEGRGKEGGESRWEGSGRTKLL